MVAGSDIVGEMTRDAAESIVAAASARPKGVGSATVVVESLSGAVRDVEPGGTAFPWRREAACLQWYTEPSSPETVDAARAWLTDAHETLGTHSVGGYVNYVEPDMPVARYFGGNLDRLTAIRPDLRSRRRDVFVVALLNRASADTKSCWSDGYVAEVPGPSV